MIGSSNRVRVVLALTVAAVAALAATSQAAPGQAGQPDPTWGGTGYVITPFAEGDAFGEDVLARGKNVIATGPVCGDDCDFGLAQYTKDGSLDSKFGTAGQTTNDFGGFDIPTSLAEQGDKIVVAGYTDAAASEDDFIVARYDKDGSLDEKFGNGGFVTTDFGGDDVADAVVVKGDRITVAGATTANGDNDFALAQYKKDGDLDEKFGAGGLVTTDFNDGFDAANGVRVMDDKVVAAGYVCSTANDSASGCDSSGEFDFGLARYKKDGSLDPSFDGDGKVETDFNGDSDLAHALDIRGDTIAAMGEAGNGSDKDLAVAEYNKSGALDTRFGGDGKATMGVNGDDVAGGGAIQDDHRVVVAGGTPFGLFGDRFLVARFTKDGSADATFGTAGATETMIGTDSAAQAMTVAPDNKIVAAGYTCNGSCDYAVARYFGK